MLLQVVGITKRLTPLFTFILFLTYVFSCKWEWLLAFAPLPLYTDRLKGSMTSSWSSLSTQTSSLILSAQPLDSISRPHRSTLPCIHSPLHCPPPCSSRCLPRLPHNCPTILDYYSVKLTLYTRGCLANPAFQWPVRVSLE